MLIIESVVRETMKKLTFAAKRNTSHETQWLQWSLYAGKSSQYSLFIVPNPNSRLPLTPLEVTLSSNNSCLFLLHYDFSCILLLFVSLLSCCLLLPADGSIHVFSQDSTAAGPPRSNHRGWRRWQFPRAQIRAPPALGRYLTALSAPSSAPQVSPRRPSNAFLSSG